MRLPRAPFRVPFNQNYKRVRQSRRSCKAAPRTSCRPPRAEGDGPGALDTELGILRDVFRMLPAGVTVQDEHGRFLLVNDAAAVQLRLAASGPAAPASPELNQRRETGLGLLRAGRAAVTEECVTSGEARQVFLTDASPGPHRRAQSPAFELGRHQRAKSRRGSSVPLGLLRRADRSADAARDRASRQQPAAARSAGTVRARLSRHRQFQAHQRLLRPCDRGRAAGGGRRAAWAGLARIRHAVADQRRRIPAAAQSDPERKRGGGIHPVHAGPAEGPVLHRRIGNIRFHLDRGEPLSRSRPQLRRAAPERRYRDVPRQERRQGRRGLLRRRHGARGARAHEGRAVAAARHPGKAFLLRLPGKGRHQDPGHQGHRGAGAPARRRGRHSGSRHLHQSRRRARTDRRAHASGAGRDRQVDRSHQRRPSVTTPRSASTSRRSRPATPNSCARSRRRSRRPDFPSAS